MSFYNGILNHYDESGLENIRGARGSPGIGFKLNLNNDYDMQNKKLVNVKQGTNNNDVITKSQLDIKTSLLDGSRPSYVVNDKAAIYSGTGALHAQSLYLKDTPDGAGNSDEIRIMTEHQSYNNIHLHVPDLKNYDGHGGRPKSEMMITSVDQTVTGKKVFENIEVHDPTSNNQASNKIYVDSAIKKLDSTLPNKFVKNTGDQMNGDLILPHDSYPVQGNTNKAVSYETQREIFLSRKESFPMETDINMNNNFIQNVATPTTSHQGANKGYCDYNFLNRQKGGRIMGSLSMNQNDLFEIPAPKFGSSAVNKNYVDGEITKIDTTQFVEKVGDTMSGVLNMNGNKIKNVGTPYTYENDAAVNVGFFNTELNASNSNVFTQITNAYKKYFEDQLRQSHLLPSHKENAFKYLLNRDESSSERNITVNGIVDYDGSPHKNKKAYDIDLIYTQGTQNYDSQIGINIYPLPVGKFTIIMEYYYPENIGITVSCQASTAIINKQISKNFSDYIKLLVQFDQRTKDTPDYLYFNIRGSGTTSTNPEGYLVFYGMTEWLDSVNPRIYDHALESSMFKYDNGNMKMNTVLDMNNKKITNLSDGTDANDAVNVSQMERLENEIIPLQTFIKNQIYIRIFKLHFYDLKEPILYRFSPPNLTGISNVWTPTEGLSFSSSSQGGLTINSLDPIKGLQFDSNMKILLNLGNTVGQSTPYTILISMTLKDKITLHFSNSTNSNDFRYPGYILDYATEKLIFERRPGNYGVVYFPSKLKNEQVMIWIKFNPTSRHYQFNLAHVTTLDTHEYPLSHFTATKLCIVPGINIINKICYLNSYIDNADHFHHLIFEEKKKDHISNNLTNIYENC